jgi:aminoglycoside phosphotransferase family enzyme/predicted kinase
MGTLKEDLARVDAYPPPRPSRIEPVETHISWVFLTDADALKVKKPARFSFLDFGTLEKRRAACDAEVALNARLAPSVYRGLVPVVRRPDGRAAFDGPGEVVDWAVRMRRLPDERRADVLLASGALGGAEVDHVAARLAEFHEACATGAAISAFGARDAVAKNVEENFAETRDALPSYLSADEIMQIERFQRGFLGDGAHVFAARIAAGRVRDGHGDLRLEHVYLDGDAITVIDCIEFADRFRYADVASDLAFLSMDLAYHGAVDLAERLLARWAAATNDFQAYAVVDFYESYRAFVRGKIAHLLASDEGAPVETRAAARHAARRYFLLALAGGRAPALAPQVVAVGGVIASGKTTIADEIGAALAAPIISADRTRKHMLGARPTEHVHDGAWKGAYEPGFTDQVYAEILRRADVVLASGRPVVLDASFRSPALRAAARDLAAARSVPFRFVECCASREVALARLAERAKAESVSDGRLEIYDEFCRRWEPPSELPSGEHVVLDTSRPLDESLAKAREHVATWPRGLVA